MPPGEARRSSPFGIRGASVSTASYRGVPLEHLAIEHVAWQHHDHLGRVVPSSLGYWDLTPEAATVAALDSQRLVAVDGPALVVLGWCPWLAPLNRYTGGRVVKVWLVAKDPFRGEWWGAWADNGNNDDFSDYGRVPRAAS